MIPQPTDFFLLFEQDHARREAAAANEKLRAHRHFTVSVRRRKTRTAVCRPHTARAG